MNAGLNNNKYQYMCVAEKLHVALRRFYWFWHIATKLRNIMDYIH